MKIFKRIIVLYFCFVGILCTVFTGIVLINANDILLNAIGVFLLIVGFLSFQSTASDLYSSYLKKKNAKNQEKDN